MSDIVHDNAHLTIDNLQGGEDYKFRFTPIPAGTSNINEGNASQLSLVLDVKMPSARKVTCQFNDFITAEIHSSLFGHSSREE